MPQPACPSAAVIKARFPAVQDGGTGRSQARSMALVRTFIAPFILFLVFSDGYRVDAREPAVQIDIGAAARAERPRRRRCRLAANRTKWARRFGHGFEYGSASPVMPSLELVLGLELVPSLEFTARYGFTTRRQTPSVTPSRVLDQNTTRSRSASRNGSDSPRHSTTPPSRRAASPRWPSTTRRS